MRRIIPFAAAALLLGAAPAPAEAQSRPGGCLKYGLGGAIAGHFAGGHRIKGALAGCALGIYQRRRYEQEAQERARSRDIERRRDPRLDPSDRPSTRERPNWTEDTVAGRSGSRTAEQARRGEMGRASGPDQRSPYEDLGLDLGRDRSRAQDGGAARGSSGSFIRGQAGERRRPRASEPDDTGSLLRGNGTVY